jgi:hypothetical protein
MLALNCRSMCLRVLGFMHYMLILKLLCLERNLLFGVVMVAMVELSMIDSADVVVMLLGKNLLVMDWLNGVMVMILMNFPIDSRVYFLMLGRLDSLMLHGRIYCLVHGGIMFA